MLEDCVLNLFILVLWNLYRNRSTGEAESSSTKPLTADSGCLSHQLPFKALVHFPDCKEDQKSRFRCKECELSANLNVAWWSTSGPHSLPPVRSRSDLTYRRKVGDRTPFVPTIESNQPPCHPNHRKTGLCPSSEADHLPKSSWQARYRLAVRRASRLT